MQTATFSFLLLLLVEMRLAAKMTTLVLPPRKFFRSFQILSALRYSKLNNPTEAAIFGFSLVSIFLVFIWVSYFWGPYLEESDLEVFEREDIQPGDQTICTCRESST